MLRGKLLKLREKRVRPGLDDKVLADWNGLMIAALVNAGIILDEPGWIDMAARAFDFIAQQYDARTSALDTPGAPANCCFPAWRPTSPP